MKKDKKIFQIYSTLLLAFILFFTSLVYPIKALDNIHISLDSNDKTTIPENLASIKLDTPLTLYNTNLVLTPKIVKMKISLLNSIT